MMMKSIVKVGVALVLVLGITACNGKDKPKNEVFTPLGGVQTVSHIDASDRAAWVYYSLKDKKVIKTRVEYPESKIDKSYDPAKDASWDIAFHRGELRVNDSHFAGKAAVATLDSKDFEVKVKVSDLEWITNEVGKLAVGMDFQAMTQGKPDIYTYEETLWVSKEPKENPIKYRTCLFNAKRVREEQAMGNIDKMYDSNPYIMIVRGADGKSFYKVQWTGFKTAKGGAGGVSFKYQKIEIK